MKNRASHVVGDGQQSVVLNHYFVSDGGTKSQTFFFAHQKGVKNV